MLSSLAVFSLFGYIIFKALQKPWIGVVGFYSFLCLDPAWNWRWALPAGFRFQFYIFIATAIGFAFNGFQYKPLSSATKFSLCCLAILFLLLKASQLSSISPYDSDNFMNTYWKTQAIMLLGILLIDTPKKLIYLLGGVLAGISYNAYQINLEYFQIGYCRYARMSFWGSYNLDNNTLSIMLVPAMAIGLSFLFTQKDYRVRIGGAIAAALCGHELMLLESRGTWLGALTTIALAVLLLPKGRKNKSIFCVLMLITATLAGPPVIAEWNSIFPDANGERDESAESRYEMWRAGWEITNEHPLFGVGPNAARVLVPGKMGLPLPKKALHNLFFDYSTSAGYPALLAYLAFGLTAWLSCFRSYSKESVNDPCNLVKFSVLIGLPGFWVASCFSSAPLLETSYVILFAGLCTSNIEFSSRHLANLQSQQAEAPQLLPQEQFAPSST